MPQVLNLLVGPTRDLNTSSVFLRGLDVSRGTPDEDTVYNRGEALPISWQQTSSSYNTHSWDQGPSTISFADTAHGIHRFNLSWYGVVTHLPPTSQIWLEDPVQSITFRLQCSDCANIPAPGVSTADFTVVMRPTSESRLGALYGGGVGAPAVEFERYRDFGISVSTVRHDDLGTIPEDRPSDEFDLEGEVETLRLLEGQAHQLEAQIAARRKAIAYTLKQDRDKLCLKHLVKECDGVACAARAVLQRICDKVGIRTDPTYGFSRMSSGLQKSIKFHPDQQLNEVNEKEATTAEGMNVPLIQTKGDDYALHAAYSNQGFDFVTSSHPIARAVQVVAGVLGLTAILAFIKRRCMSIRKRTERAADLEERRNARAYRRAARRAEMRKRWNDFFSSLNCFASKINPRTGDYEEKRALILQDAFLEQDLDQAEKGEVMEAEIRELRYAHEIVSSLVRVDEHSYAIATPIMNDPPPSRVPLPPPHYSTRPNSTRSRANSSYTLPSYFSESLPDYTSRPGNETPSASSIANGYTPSTSESQGRNSPFSPISESSRVTRYTPVSSVLEMSPRASEETLRTRPSRDAQVRGQSLDSVLRL